MFSRPTTTPRPAAARHGSSSAPLTPASLRDEDLHVLQSLPEFWERLESANPDLDAAVVKARLSQLIENSPWTDDQEIQFHAALTQVVAAGEKVYQIVFFNLLEGYSNSSKLTVAPYYYKGSSGANCEIDATVTFLYKTGPGKEHIQIPLLCVEFKDPANFTDSSDRMSAHTQLGERFKYIREMLVKEGVLDNLLQRIEFLYGVSSYGFRLKFYQYDLQHGVMRPVLPEIPEEFQTIQTRVPIEEEWQYHLLYSNGVDAFNSLWEELHRQLRELGIIVGKTPIQPSGVEIWKFKEFQPTYKAVFDAPKMSQRKRAEVKRDIKESLPPPVKVQKPTRSGRIPKVPEPVGPLTSSDPRGSSSSGAGGPAPPPGHDAGSGSRPRTTQAALISPSYGASSSSAFYAPSYGQPTAGPSRSQTLGGVSSQQQQYQAQAQGYVPSYLPEPPAPSSSRPQRSATAPQPTYSVDALADEFENANLDGPSSSSRGSRSRTSRDPYGRHQ